MNFHGPEENTLRADAREDIVRRRICSGAVVPCDQPWWLITATVELLRVGAMEKAKTSRAVRMVLEHGAVPA